MKKIIFTGGGTAGHIYPSLAIIEDLPKDYEIHYIGGKGMEKEIISKIPNIFYHQIDTVKLERKLTLKNLLIPFRLHKSIKQAKKIINEIKPNIIFSKGGYVAVPVVIAGAKQKIPVLSHESDLTIGLANKIILHYCKKMCVSFKETKKYNKKCIYTGQPIRKNILQGDKNKIKFNSYNKNNPNLLIIGGSTGAKFINEKVWQNLDSLTQNFNVLHITGKQAKEQIKHNFYNQIQYSNNIGDCLDFADIILSRAGSGAINEFLALKKTMLLIPLSKKCSRGDQIDNAKLFTKEGFCEMLEEENYSDELLINLLNALYKNKQIYIKNMNQCVIPNTNQKIIDLILKYEKK